MKEENEENLIESEENTSLVIHDFNNIQKKSEKSLDVFTNITDKKKIFNLSNNVDFLLNDCENEKICVKEVLIKRYLKGLENPIIDDETGEIIKDTEMTMSTVLIDTEGKSYATGSKMFGIQIMQYLEMFSSREGFEPFEIKITKKKMKDNNNKCLSFELI